MKFTVWERVQIGTILGAQKGPVGHIRKCLKLMDALELTDDEKKSAGFVSNGLRMEWATELTADIDLSDEDYKFLKGIVESFDGWPVDPRTMELAEKFD